MQRKERIHIFCSELRHWFSVHKRTLPWRDLDVKDSNHRAYLVLVSEVMLQQTQVSRVIILYKKFIQTFPRILDLSRASNREVLIAWRGLGYNSRALRLRDAAKTIVAEHGGRFPHAAENLQRISGIGHYTAGALRNFTFDLPTACIDTNIRRILHRCFIGLENADGSWIKSDKMLRKLLEEVMTEAMKSGWSPKDFYAALMDFGSLVCTKNNPQWHLFPHGMKAIFKAYGKQKKRIKKLIKKEPGREVAGRFIPNRIFRGRVIDALREEERGLTLEQIGKRVVIDWSMEDLRAWLRGLLEKLMKDELIEMKERKYILHL